MLVTAAAFAAKVHACTNSHATGLHRWECSYSVFQAERHACVQFGYLLYNLTLHLTANNSSAPLPPGCHMSTKCISQVCAEHKVTSGGRALQVLHKKLRRLNDDLKREAAAEIDALAAQVHMHTHAHTHQILHCPATCVLESMHPSVESRCAPKCNTAA